MNLAETVFGDADSDWNTTRKELEEKVLKAAAELLAHSGASACTVQGFGTQAKIEALPCAH